MRRGPPVLGLSLEPQRVELAVTAVSIDNCGTVDQGNSALEETGLW
jgi:hypothetical protein